MNERWKYQLKTGGIWGVFMVVFSTVFALEDKPLAIQLASTNFYLRGVIYIAIGVFILGYFNWKAKMKREQNKQ